LLRSLGRVGYELSVLMLKGEVEIDREKLGSIFQLLELARAKLRAEQTDGIALKNALTTEEGSDSRHGDSFEGKINSFILSVLLHCKP